MTGLARALPILGVIAACGAGTAGRPVAVPGPSSPGTATEELESDLLLPADAEATWLVRAEDLGTRLTLEPRLRVWLPEGSAVLLAGSTFLPVASTAGSAVDPPFVVPSASDLSDAAWMTDGTLALVVGRQFGVAGASGFASLVDLPAADMQVAVGGPDRCFIFGGPNLLLYRKGGTALSLLRLPAPDAIGAVAGTPARFFVATGSTVLAFEPGSPPAVVYDDGEGAGSTTLADAPGGVFVGSDRGVTFVSTDGRAVAPVLRGWPAQVASGTDVLYVWIRGQGLLRIAPVAGYAPLARGSR